MTTTSQLVVRHEDGVGHYIDEGKLLLASAAAVGSFAALVDGRNGAALALMAMFVLVIALDQRRPH